MAPCVTGSPEADDNVIKWNPMKYCIKYTCSNKNIKLFSIIIFSILFFGLD